MIIADLYQWLNHAYLQYGEVQLDTNCIYRSGIGTLRYISATEETSPIINRYAKQMEIRCVPFKGTHAEMGKTILGCHISRNRSVLMSGLSFFVDKDLY